jgi:hypothetical protein
VFQEASVHKLVFLLIFIAATATAKPILTATCGEPVGTRYDQENGVVRVKSDGFSGVNPVFIIDDEKLKTLTFIWGPAGWAKKELEMKANAQEAVIILFTEEKITAVRVEEQGVTQMYSLYPTKGLVFFTQHRYITFAGGVPTTSTFYARCSFSGS